MAVEIEKVVLERTPMHRQGPSEPDPQVVGATDRRPGRVVVVLPTYNEAKNLPLVVQALAKLDLADLKVLVVDDASPDGTGQLAESLRELYAQLHVIHRSGKLGLGTAYVEGFKWALDNGADFIVQMDADLSHEPIRILHMLDAINGNDVIVGSRYVGGGEVDPRWSRSRKWLSAFANRYARTILRSNVCDMTGGFKCFKRSALEMLDLDTIRSNGYAFQVEVAHRCQRLGLKVAEHPIRFYERNGGVSKMSMAVSAEAAWRVWQLRVLSWIRDIVGK